MPGVKQVGWLRRDRRGHEKKTDYPHNNHTSVCVPFFHLNQGPGAIPDTAVSSLRPRQCGQLSGAEFLSF